MNRALIITAILLIAFCAINLPSFADSSSSTEMDFEVDQISSITVSGNPGNLTINTATSGQNPGSVSDVSTTYDVIANQTNKKITGQITNGTAMPSGMSLKASLAAPTGGTSTGLQSLDTGVAADLVTGIPTVSEDGLSITYQLNATAAAGTLTSASKTITLTITDGA